MIQTSASTIEQKHQSNVCHCQVNIVEVNIYCNISRFIIKRWLWICHFLQRAVRHPRTRSFLHFFLLFFIFYFWFDGKFSACEKVGAKIFRADFHNHVLISESFFKCHINGRLNLQRSLLKLFCICNTRMHFLPLGQDIRLHNFSNAWSRKKSVLR